MSDAETLIVLMAVAVALVWLADQVSVPYPIVLVLGGLGIGFLPGGPQLELDPELLFLVFLPPLLQSAGYYASPQELRAEKWPLSVLVILLPLTTMVVVALVAEAVIPELTLAEAFVLGAIVAPTDPIASLVSFASIGVSERVSLLVESEGMLNDATALVAYRVALAAVVTGSFAAGDAAVDLLVSIAGGVLVGLAVAWLAANAIKRLDDPPLVILLTVLTSYVSFSIAEDIGASGVLAVVTGGLWFGWRSHEILDADLRLSSAAFWRVLVFALNAVLFILLGLQFPEILRRVGEQFTVGEIFGYGLLVSVAVVGTRLAWQFGSLWLQRLVPPLATLGAGEGWRERLLIGWSGMRGAVSLAAALALPFELDSGAPLGERDLIIYLTVAVILFTLVLQGLTLPALVRLLGLGMQEPWAPDEAIARLAAAQAALDRIGELETSAEPVPEPTMERLRELYQARFARSVSSLAGDRSPMSIENPLDGYRGARQQLIDAERGALIELRSQGRVKGDVFRRIQRDLDLDESRLRS